MPEKKRLFNTAVGKKILSALTGLFLCVFLVLHLLGNLLIYVGKDAVNLYSKVLNGLPILVAFELGLLALFLAHAYLGIRVYIENRNARPQEYYQRRWTRDGKTGEGATASRKSWGSTTMAVSGTITIIFLVGHVWHFKYASYNPFKDASQARAGTSLSTNARTAGTGAAAVENHNNAGTTAQDGEHSHDLGGQMEKDFQNPIIVILYLISLVLLTMHLNHGFASAFQSMGVGGLSKTMLIVGRVFTFVIMGGFMSIPIVLFFWRR